MTLFYIKKMYILVLFFLLSGCVGLPKLLRTDQYCQSVVCNASAIVKPYPTSGFTEKTQTIYLQSFKLNVPVGGRVHEATSIRKQIVYQNHIGLLVQEIREEDFELDVPQAFSKGQFKIIDYPAIMFLNTAQQPDPSDYYDRYIWRLALNNKGNYFKKI